MQKLLAAIYKIDSIISFKFIMLGSRMYITIKQAPTDEQIKQFNMKLSEEDTYVNYKVDLSQFDEALRKAFIETFKIDAAAIEGRQFIILTRFVEI